jgi:starch synthase
LKAGRGPPAGRPKTVFTIHNLGYQGLFPKTKFGLLGLPPDYFSLHGIEFYDQVSLLKAGLVYSDYLTTVSPTYAREIQTADFGFGLDGILKERSGQLRGILNGIDCEIWNPTKDRMIYYNYRDHHDKSINTIQLKKEAGLESGDQPLIGIVSRLAAQKGIDLLCDVFDAIMAWGYQLIILGTGEEEYHRRLKEQADKYPRQVSLNLKFDEQLAHRIYAGADIFLMPSRYEPCGLGQMIALTYATVPVVRRTGGLADSVFEFDTAARTGNGFLFEDYKSGALLAALKRAREVFDNPDLWSALVSNTRQYDFSWRRAAKEYQALYRELLGQK